MTDKDTTNPLPDGLPDDLKLYAYYYSFDETGERPIDYILHAVGRAGKAYHHTDRWREETDGESYGCEGGSPVEWIQNAANKAAALFASERKARLEAEERAEELRALADRSAGESGLYARRMSEAQAARDKAEAQVAQLTRERDAAIQAREDNREIMLTRLSERMQELDDVRADNARLRELLEEALPSLRASWVLHGDNELEPVIDRIDAALSNSAGSERGEQAEAAEKEADKP